MNILAPIPINFNKVEIGAILVPFEKKIQDKDSHKPFNYKRKSAYLTMRAFESYLTRITISVRSSKGGA